MRKRRLQRSDWVRACLYLTGVCRRNKMAFLKSWQMSPCSRYCHSSKRADEEPWLELEFSFTLSKQWASHISANLTIKEFQGGKYVGSKIIHLQLRGCIQEKTGMVNHASPLFAHFSKKENPHDLFHHLSDSSVILSTCDFSVYFFIILCLHQLFILAPKMQPKQICHFICYRTCGQNITKQCNKCRQIYSSLPSI